MLQQSYELTWHGATGLGTCSQLQSRIGRMEACGSRTCIRVPLPLSFAPVISRNHFCGCSTWAPGSCCCCIPKVLVGLPSMLTSTHFTYEAAM